jgi:hypothetical protein
MEIDLLNQAKHCYPSLGLQQYSYITPPCPILTQTTSNTSDSSSTALSLCVFIFNAFLVQFVSCYLGIGFRLSSSIGRTACCRQRHC